MGIGKILSILFEKIPEFKIKNDFRYFLAFNPLVPKFISDISPIKGYVMYRKLKKGDYIVDAGSYPGDFAVFASRKIGPKGKIICFEPNLKNRKILKKNLEKEKNNNFIIIPKGLWNKNTNLKIKSYDGLHTELGAEGESQKIQVVKLDDELKKLKIKKLDVLKMDIEGAEIEAIEGCREILGKFSPFVCIASYHVVNGKQTFTFIESFLKSIGYKSKTDFPNHLTTFGWKNK